MNKAQAVYEKSVFAVGSGIGVLGAIILPLLLLSSARFVPCIILGFIYYGYFRRPEKAKWPLRKMWLTFWLVLLLVRVDVSFRNVPGAPRIVPYVIGLPGRGMFQKVQRGEVVLHGCTATGLEPFWVLVW